MKRWLSLGSMRLRLTIAFLLVSVPPMLAAALIAAQLLSNAFDRNLNQWLTETLNFFIAETEEGQSETERAARIIAERFEPGVPFPDESSFKPSLELLNALGIDLIMIEDGATRRMFSAIDVREITPLPDRSTGSIFLVKAEGRSILAVGAVHVFEHDGHRARVVVANWLGDSFNNVGRAVRALQFEVFLFENGHLTRVETIDHHGIPAALPDEDTLKKISRASEPVVYDPVEDGPIYMSAYAPLRAADGTLLGVLAASVEQGEDLFEQINKWHLFNGIFVVGSILSILAGFGMSGLLARPVQRLTSAVRSVSRGDFRQRVPERGGTELEELARSFNAMSRDLERLRAMEADLYHREKLSALGEAAAVIAHEIRNPLGIIKTSADLVRSRSQLAPSEDRMMGYITDEVKRIDRLVRDFLDFARAAPRHPRLIALGELLERARDIMRPEFELHAISFSIDDDGSAPEVMADPDHIYQAVLNLILNAMDAMPQGGPITARLRAEGEGAVLSIIDGGPGLSEDMAAKVFDPFFTTKSKGSGLGLAKVRSIMEGHRGRVLWRRPQGGGAQFDLIFPESMTP
jgi:two-component system sensor histidine kinase HydH